jgi:UDP-glucose 4-epimerase
MYTGVMAILIPKMLRQERATIYGDGEQSRDFTYIDNVVDANLLACHAPADQVAGRYFNIAGGRRITVNETYLLLQKLLGYSEPALYAPERPGDIKHSLADIRLAEQCLGYRPSVDFEDGLRRTVEWYRMQSLSPAGAVRA